MEKNRITQYFEDVETTKEIQWLFLQCSRSNHNRNSRKYLWFKKCQPIHQWATSNRVNEFLTAKLKYAEKTCNEYHKTI